MATYSVILAWEIHGQRSLVGYSPGGSKESDTTEWLSTKKEVSNSTAGSLRAGTPQSPPCPRFPELPCWVHSSCTHSCVHTCPATTTSQHPAELFTIAKARKQPKCPSTEEWVKMYVCCIPYIWRNEKEGNNAICNNMDGPRGFHSKWSKSEKDKYHVILLICGLLKN